MQMILKSRLLMLVISALLIACSPPKNQETHITGPTMGTTYNVKFVPVVGVDKETLKQQIEQSLIDINLLMSTYIENSELSRFNQWSSVEPFPMSARTLQVLNEAKRLGNMSDGLLDVTVGPLVNLWGFGPQSRPVKMPSDELIKMTRQQVGLNKLTLGPSWASKTEPTLYVDLSTIAKGFAVDQLAELLGTHEITNYLVEIGGEMRLSGLKASGTPWKIAIEKPETDQRSVQKIISIGTNAVATSGDYRNYYETDGVRYSHLINPNTGYPISHNLVSVTVIHPSSMTADGLATALNVMGKEKALELAETFNIAVLLITKEKDGFNEYTSVKFEQLVTVH
ncbi:FAD:protein FMN transferase [Paraglaciecola sp. MB-3u-78]|jgi:thiamine biosynthesis lipoprotein|uniref:FAD:protein FMN transferase n=1 Tax=Paraglaciecola sp. MB-3u-78 TaxID=2058332 RepID=UPI000C34C44F|nr:FAD:protein FMN transferase [Paraglaciecola sp. MB-3u-78]PKG98247.1 FAD:protein FMN transferase ApbE [Paraglaciecola sp. MB-3u-78]